MILLSTSSLLLSDVLLALKAARPLSDEERKILQEEIKADPEQRGYEKLENPELLVTLCSAYQMANPDEQGIVQLATLSAEALRAFINSKIGRIISEPKLEDKWTKRLTLLLGTIPPQIDLTGSGDTDLIQTLLTESVADGLIAIEDWMALISAPDPAYQAILYRQARADIVLGLSGVVLELSDVEGLR